MNESPIAGTTKVTAPNRVLTFSSSPDVAELLLKVAGREEITKPGQKKPKKVSAPRVFVPYSVLPSPEGMRHLHALRLNVTHSHTLPTRILADSSKIKTGTWCPVSHQRSGTDARDLLKDNYRRIYPQRKEDIQLILWWLFFTLKHGSSYPFFWDEHTAIIYSSITPGLH